MTLNYTFALHRPALITSVPLLGFSEESQGCCAFFASPNYDPKLQKGSSWHSTQSQEVYETPLRIFDPIHTFCPFRSSIEPNHLVLLDNVPELFPLAQWEVALDSWEFVCWLAGGAPPANEVLIWVDVYKYQIRQLEPFRGETDKQRLHPNVKVTVEWLDQWTVWRWCSHPRNTYVPRPRAARCV